ncbi:hypothetical protein ABMY12_20875 [Vibrio vulnificus]|uniref:hypothetical protein n=1 Tax=Vibrio vulnificus TaxID=672 RepID=UPI0040590746
MARESILSTACLEPSLWLGSSAKISSLRQQMYCEKIAKIQQINCNKHQKALESIANVCIIYCKSTEKGEVVENSVESIAKRMAAEIKEGAFKLQTIFDRNIQNIEALRKDGYTYIRIYQMLLTELSGDVELNERHYRDLIYRARKKITPRPNSPAKGVDTKKITMEAIAITNKESDKDKTQEHNWLEIGIKKPILIEKLEAAGLTPSDVEMWGLPNEMQISKRLTEYMMKKN